HHEQQHRNSCVPACMGMVQRWRGLPSTEAALHEGASPAGWPLTHAAQLGRVRLASIGAGEEEEIDLALRVGRLAIVTVSGPPYVRWFERRSPGRQSRHGILCGPGTFGWPFHCLLLVARRTQGYDFHDPWYPADDQPFHLPDDDFQRCFAGGVAIAEP